MNAYGRNLNSVREARFELRRPLVIGDDRQIAARNTLRELDDIKQAILNCDACHLNDDAGPGWARRIAACDCVLPWIDEHLFPEIPSIVLEAIRELGRENFRS